MYINNGSAEHTSYHEQENIIETLFFLPPDLDLEHVEADVPIKLGLVLEFLDVGQEGLPFLQVVRLY